MKLIFEVHTHPDSFELEDGILNILNDDGLRQDVETALKSVLESIAWHSDKFPIRVSVKLKEWV